MRFQNYYKKDADLCAEAFALIDEMKNGNDLEKEIGISRSAIARITRKAISKIYASLKANADKDTTPSDIVMAIVSYMQANGDGDFEHVAKEVVRYLEASQKAEFIEDLKTRVPNAIARQKFGVK